MVSKRKIFFTLCFVCLLMSVEARANERDTEEENASFSWEQGGGDFWGEETFSEVSPLEEYDSDEKDHELKEADRQFQEDLEEKASEKGSLEEEKAPEETIETEKIHEEESYLDSFLDDSQKTEKNQGEEVQGALEALAEPQEEAKDSLFEERQDSTLEAPVVEAKVTPETAPVAVPESISEVVRELTEEEKEELKAWREAWAGRFSLSAKALWGAQLGLSFFLKNVEAMMGPTMTTLLLGSTLFGKYALWGGEEWMRSNGFEDWKKTEKWTDIKNWRDPEGYFLRAIAVFSDLVFIKKSRLVKAMILESNMALEYIKNNLSKLNISLRNKMGENFKKAEKESQSYVWKFFSWFVSPRVSPSSFPDEAFVLPQGKPQPKDTSGGDSEKVQACKKLEIQINQLNKQIENSKLELEFSKQNPQWGNDIERQKGRIGGYEKEKAEKEKALKELQASLRED